MQPRGWILAALSLCMWPAPRAEAHFLFARVLPAAEGGRAAEVYFSELAQAGDARFIDKIANTRLWLQQTPGTFTPNCCSSWPVSSNVGMCARNLPLTITAIGISATQENRNLIASDRGLTMSWPRPPTAALAADRTAMIVDRPTGGTSRCTHRRPRDGVSGSVARLTERTRAGAGDKEARHRGLRDVAGNGLAGRCHWTSRRRTRYRFSAVLRRICPLRVSAAVSQGQRE